MVAPQPFYTNAEMPLLPSVFHRCAVLQSLLLLLHNSKGRHMPCAMSSIQHTFEVANLQRTNDKVHRHNTTYTEVHITPQNTLCDGGLESETAKKMCIF